MGVMHEAVSARVRVVDYVQYVRAESSMYSVCVCENQDIMCNAFEFVIKGM